MVTAHFSQPLSLPKTSVIEELKEPEEYKQEENKKPDTDTHSSHGTQMMYQSNIDSQ